MRNNKAKYMLQELFDLADISLERDNPCNIQVHNEDFYGRVLRDGALGLGESYVEGWWDSSALDGFMCKVLLAGLNNKVRMNCRRGWHRLKSRIFNLQKINRAFQVAAKHYDIGNDLYRAMLDRRMVYTSAYWKDAEDLDAAQEAKLDLVCRKIELKEGMKVLDLGCGWGSFAKYAAERYGARVTGVTVAKEQVELGRELCKGLPVEIFLEDYRHVTGKFDRVISIGIMEHVGYKNYHTYMKKVESLLERDGIAFLHTIGGNISKTTSDPWTTKYIFPNGMLPSVAQIGKAMEGIFVMEDWHNFGPDYDRTLMAWHANFEKAWPVLREKYGDRFYRMWRYYLLACAGAFRSRSIQLWQIVMTVQGRKRPNCRVS